MIRKVLVLYSEDYLKHDPRPYEHPENPRRLFYVLTGLDEFGVIPKYATIEEPPKDDIKVFSLVHHDSYIREVEEYLNTRRTFYIDPDTYVSRGTRTALERLAGGVKLLVEKLSEGVHTVLLGRPPGHHAGVSGPAMGVHTQGFCIFNSAALAAILLSKKGRVALVDIDVHHGNGTQEIFWNSSILHIDIHQDPDTLYPGTGYPSDVGGVRGTKINFTVIPGVGDDILLDIVEIAYSFLEEYDPDYVIVSAGFDGYRGDNELALLRATSNYFYSIGRMLYELKIPVGTILEGGYGEGLSRGLPAYIAGLFGVKDPVKDPFTTSVDMFWEKHEYMLKVLRESLGRELGRKKLDIR